MKVRLESMITPRKVLGYGAQELAELGRGAKTECGLYVVRGRITGIYEYTSRTPGRDGEMLKGEGLVGEFVASVKFGPRAGETVMASKMHLPRAAHDLLLVSAKNAGAGEVLEFQAGVGIQADASSSIGYKYVVSFHDQIGTLTLKLLEFRPEEEAEDLI